MQLYSDMELGKDIMQLKSIFSNLSTAYKNAEEYVVKTNEKFIPRIQFISLQFTSIFNKDIRQ